MELEIKTNSTWPRIPIIVDVTKRVIDGQSMVRCSYFSILSEEPMQNWAINSDNINSPILLLNFESILIGPSSDTHYFSSFEEIERMYQLEESHSELFVDINDIWIPTPWFAHQKLEQGQLHRISADRFSRCWKLRNDLISIEELLDDEGTVLQEHIAKESSPSLVRYSPEESASFEQWTKKQIDRSSTIYHQNRERYLKKIES